MSENQIGQRSYKKQFNIPDEKPMRLRYNEIILFLTAPTFHTLQWRHNGRDGVSNHRRLDCLLNRLFGCKSKKTLKVRVHGLCEGNSPVTGEFPAQRANNAKMLPLDDVIMIDDAITCHELYIWVCFVLFPCGHIRSCDSSIGFRVDLLKLG